MRGFANLIYSVFGVLLAGGARRGGSHLSCPRWFVGCFERKPSAVVGRSKDRQAAIRLYPGCITVVSGLVEEILRVDWFDPVLFSSCFVVIVVVLFCFFFSSCSFSIICFIAVLYTKWRRGC